MKDNLNIEELFQDKFNSFEGEVSPDAWANIQQGMNVAGTAGTGAATGMSLLMKGLIAGGIVAATVTGIYLFSDSTEQEVPLENNLVVNDQTDNSTNNISVDQAPVQDENLLGNTIDGLNDAGENRNTELNDEVNNPVEENDEAENHGGVIADNGEGSSGGASVDESNRGGNENNDVAADVNQGNEQNVDPILPDPVEEKHISSELSFESGNEFAPTTYTFHANSENARRVEWVFEDGTVLEGEDVTFTFEKPGKYAVTMMVYGNGESDNETVEIVIKSSASINTLPNIITPNGDRMNDFFAISTTDIETFEIKITDLQGKVLFESTDVNFRWYGTDLSGEQLSKGVYIYSFFAKGIDGSEFKKADQITLK